MQRAAVILACLGCGLIAPTVAAAKGDVRATLADPAALARAAPGERIRVAWMLSAAPRLPTPAPATRDRSRRPFGASGVYIRVEEPGGTSRVFPARSPAARGYPAGRYVAAVTIPRGGIASIAIGLEGLRYAAGSPPVRADVFFPVDNDPFAVRPAGSTGAPRRGLVAGSLVLALALAGLLLVVRGRRPASGRGAVLGG